MSANPLSQAPIRVAQQAKQSELVDHAQRTTVLPQLKMGRNSAGRLPQWGMHAASIQLQERVQETFAKHQLAVKPTGTHGAAGTGMELPTQSTGNSTQLRRLETGTQCQHRHIRRGCISQRLHTEQFVPAS